MPGKATPRQTPACRNPIPQTLARQQSLCTCVQTIILPCVNGRIARIELRVSVSPGPMHFTEQFDVVVVGAGHAGCEAAMAVARMGLKTALYTLNVDLIAQMSCNPAIGGIAKGHLVREVDALGGIMGEITDAVGIQFRLLNTSRGPAVWSPRAQCDKQAYRLKMREVLDSQPNLKIKQAEVADLMVEDAPGAPADAVAPLAHCH